MASNEFIIPFQKIDGKLMPSFKMIILTIISENREMEITDLELTNRIITSLSLFLKGHNLTIKEGDQLQLLFEKRLMG